MFNFLVIIGSKVIKKKMGWRLITKDETSSTVNFRCSKFILILIRIKHKHPHELPVNDTGILKKFPDSLGMESITWEIQNANRNEEYNWDTVIIRLSFPHALGPVDVSE